MSQATIRRPVRTIAPTDDPLTVDELKRQLNLSLDISAHDELLLDCIKAAVEAWEADTPVVCCTSTWVEKFDCWPNVIELTRRPVQSVSSVTYLDASGDTQTLASSSYVFDAARVKPAVVWKPLIALPALSVSDNINLVTVTYVAGYGEASDVPFLIKAALKLKAAEFFQERQATPTKPTTLEMDAYERIRAKFERSSYP